MFRCKCQSQALTKRGHAPCKKWSAQNLTGQATSSSPVGQWLCFNSQISYLEEYLRIAKKTKYQQETYILHLFLIAVRKTTIESIYQSPQFPSGPTYFYCKKKGHILSEFWALEKNQRSLTHMLVGTKVLKWITQGRIAPFVSHRTVRLEGIKKVPLIFFEILYQSANHITPYH